MKKKYSVLYFFVFYFSCCIFLYFIFRVIFCVEFFVLHFCAGIFHVICFCVVWKTICSLWQILLLYVWYIFCQTLENKVYLRVWKLGLIHYLVICLCSIWNYLSVIKLDCLLLFLLLLIIFGLHKWYCPIIFWIAFHFHCHHIIKLISPSFIAFIANHLFCLKRINKLNVLEEFSHGIGYTTECNGDLVCNATIKFTLV